MGDKIASKKLANGQGQHHPGYNDAIEDARAGGRDRQGHRLPGDDQGQRRRRRRQGPARGLQRQGGLRGLSACRNEARNSFGDDRVFIEKFVEEPRHIEIQVLGDAHGNVVYLNERECSIQRRHQKVIEEAPSPFISEATRKAMGEQAVALAKAVKYQSAGTVEFVVGKDQDFYFLEMNTRLQVEHPVTECITGLDLVEQMIRVAAGEKLPLHAGRRSARLGHGVPHQRRRPVPQLPALHRPAGALPAAASKACSSSRHQQGGGVRVDTGVYEGGEIPMYYDSMIAKLIVHGTWTATTRSARCARRSTVFVIRGISSNIPFQAALLAHPKFRGGEFNTGFIAEHYGKGFAAAVCRTTTRVSWWRWRPSRTARTAQRAPGISGQLPGHGVQVGEQFVVVALALAASTSSTRWRSGFAEKSIGLQLAVPGGRKAL